MTCVHCGGAPIGVEIPEVYDGVLYYVCAGCGFAWPRGFGLDGRLNRAAARTVAERNRTRGVAS